MIKGMTEHEEKRKRIYKKKPRLYTTWQSMKARCDLKTNTSYKWYGGKGISYCDEWREFAPFRDWAMANGYSDTLTLDRIDFNKDYSPNNCRWVTQKVQQNNRRTNHLVTIGGETHTIAEWADIYGINSGTIHSRLVGGWSEENAITKPLVRPAKKPKSEESNKSKLMSTNKSGFRGVCKTKNNTWRAYITISKRQKYLGTYKTTEEAANARQIAESKYLGGTR